MQFYTRRAGGLIGMGLGIFLAPRAERAFGLASRIPKVALSRRGNGEIRPLILEFQCPLS
jgi:hypothetical protein